MSVKGEKESRMMPGFANLAYVSFVVPYSSVHSVFGSLGIEAVINY